MGGSFGSGIPKDGGCIVKSRRLVSLDALRGLAALAVVFSHVANPGDSVPVEPIRSVLGRALAGVMDYGRVGVVLFFVISGFCIHLRWGRALAEGRSTAINFTAFWKQRFIRLYPPYLAALSLYLAIQTWTGAITWTRFDVYDLGMHLAMLHNLDARTVFSINGVFWTLAIEEQLYLAYFLLLALRGRLGWAKTLALCAGARLAWFALAFAVGRWGGDFHLAHDSGSPAHWFSWALGAVCVEAALGLITLPAWTADSRIAVLCCVAAAGCDLATGRHLGGGLGWRLTWLIGSPLWGVGFFVLVNRLVRAEATWQSLGTTPRLVTLWARLGIFSYSLYLTHNLVVQHLGPTALRWLGMANDLENRLLLVVPALALAWIFFLACEQPFLNHAARRKSQRDQPPRSAIPTLH